MSENEKAALEVKLALAHQKLEAATAQNQELSSQIQVVTQSLEEKHSIAVFQVNQKVSGLVVGLQPNLVYHGCCAKVKHYLSDCGLIRMNLSLCATPSFLPTFSAFHANIHQLFHACMGPLVCNPPQFYACILSLVH